jgi:hypothetical protein
VLPKLWATHRSRGIPTNNSAARTKCFVLMAHITRHKTLGIKQWCNPKRATSANDLATNLQIRQLRLQTDHRTCARNCPVSQSEVFALNLPVHPVHKMPKLVLLGRQGGNSGKGRKQRIACIHAYLSSCRRKSVT